MSIPKRFKKFECNLIREDLFFYKKMISELAKPDPSSLLFCGLLPHLSLFTIETSEYIKRNLPQYVSIFNKKYDKLISDSRMKIKFLDDSKNNVSGVFTLLNDIKFAVDDHFINDRHLLKLTKDLPVDLGIIFYDGHITFSTHTLLFLIGFTKEQLTANKTFDNWMVSSWSPLIKNMVKYLSDLNKKELKNIAQKKILRNILVHYELRDLPDNLVSYSFNLQRLVEYFFHGDSFKEINQKIDDQIIDIQEILEQWLNFSISEHELSDWSDLAPIENTIKLYFNN